MELEDIERFHSKFDRIIASYESCTTRSKLIITTLEERYDDFAMSDCESENEEETDLDNGFAFSSIPRDFEGLHTKVDGLIRMFESLNKIKKRNRFLETSQWIPLTVPGLDLKVDRVEELFQIEKKKQGRLVKAFTDYMMKNQGVDVRGEIGENVAAAAQVVVEEDEDCVID